MRPSRLCVRELGLALLVLIVTSYAWMFSSVSVPNERTRAYLTVALVDHGTLAIDAPLQRFGGVYDLAQFGGHFFTDKAPGSSLLAVPIYALVRTVTAADAWDIVSLCNLFRTWLVLPFGLLGFVLLRGLLRDAGVSEGARDVSSLAFSLGSPMLHYSGAFYGHVPVAALVLAAVWCLARAGRVWPAAHGGGRDWAWLIGAGACAGLAGLIEYQAIVLGAVLAVPIFFGPRRRLALGLAAYAAGAIPFAAVLLWYNARAFGGPFELSYQHLAGASLQELHGFGLAGATRPTLKVLDPMFTSPHRGLLSGSPLLAFGLGVLPFLRKRLGTALWITLLLSSVYFVLIVSSSSVWFGGWSFGLRLLIPVFGLLAFAAAAGFDAVERFPVAQTLLRACAIFAVLYHAIVVAGFAELPPDFRRPLPDAIIPMLRAGWVSPNLACKLFGLSTWNLAPLAALVAIAAGVIAWPRAGERSARVCSAAASVAAALLALAFISGAEPSRTDREQARWLSHVQRWSDAETRCRAKN